jgi:hypothetical protein
MQQSNKIMITGVLLADWLKRAEAIASGNQSAIPTKMAMYSAVRHFFSSENYLLHPNSA